MDGRFETIMLQEAKDFLASLVKKSRKKILFNIWKAKLQNDNSLFKPLADEIQEFRAFYFKKQIRLFAFWDKTDKHNTLVIATHGLIKKTSKIPKKEIQKAIELKRKYFQKNNQI